MSYTQIRSLDAEDRYIYTVMFRFLTAPLVLLIGAAAVLAV